MGKGRFTLGLYNTHHSGTPKDIHIRTISRAASVCYAFDFNLAIIGFPFKEGITEIVALIRESTTVSRKGEFLERLNTEGRLAILEPPRKGFPPNLGMPIALGPYLDEEKALAFDILVEKSMKGESFLFLLGTNYSGLPKSVKKTVPYHFDISGKNAIMDTCIIIGMLPGAVSIRTNI